jgi:transcriptional regulator with XRE-family HTH domain
MSERETRFWRFIKENRRRGITPTKLAAESGYSRVHLYNVANGDSEPTREFMDVIAAACTRLAHRPVRREDLFESKPFRGRKAI